MKGRYSGTNMTIYGSKMPGAVGIDRWSRKVDGLSDKAKKKLKVCDWCIDHDRNISLTARHFGYTRKTIREWMKRLKEKGPVGLNDKSRRPKKTRVPSTPGDIIVEIVKMRKKRPAWSKYKIAQRLEDKKDIKVSASTTGRVMKRRGLIDKKISAKRSKAAKNPRKRFPRGFSIRKPGDMVQMDVKHIMLPGGRRHYQFTAIDVLTKQRVLERYSSESSKNGASFLLQCKKEFQFEIKNIQTDNGSTFQKNFRMMCEKLGIEQYFIYPRSPKQNSYVEASHAADEREFYRLGNAYQDPDVMRKKLKEWQYDWNHIRPHQSLDYKTPYKYFMELKTRSIPTKEVIILQT